MEQRPFSDIAYQMYIDEEKLMGSRCSGCGALFAPPRPICINCRSTRMRWVELSGRGKLAAFTCIAIGPAFMIAQGFNRDNPYCCGVVELPEGVRVDARIIGVDPKKPESIKVGMPVTARYLHQQIDGKMTTFLAFAPLN